MSRGDIPVPPCDGEDPEKNWDSVSTLGNQCAELLGGTFDGRAKTAPSGRLEAANHFLERPPNSLLDELMADGEANSPPSHTGKASKRPSAIMRRISEGMEEEDKMEAMRLEILDLKAKLEEKEEKMVTMEVELEMALESLREAKEKMAAGEAAAERVERRASEEASRSSHDKSTSAYDLYSLKSRIKELEMENKRLRKQLPSSNGEEIAPENVDKDQLKGGGEKTSNNQRRGSRVSLKSISSVPTRVNFRTKSSKSLNARHGGKKKDDAAADERRRGTLNHIKSPAPVDNTIAKGNAENTEKKGRRRRISIKW